MSLVIVLLILLIVIGVLLFLMTKMYTNKFETHIKTPGEYAIPFESVRYPTENKKMLHGWWIPAPKDKTETVGNLILIHGWNRNVGRMMPYIKELHPAGYNLLVFDSRNHGSSDSDEFSSMPKFAEDIIASINYLENIRKIDLKKLGLIGLSMGGAAAIYAASKDDRIKKAITVGAFAHPAVVMKREIQKKHIPYFPVIWMFFKYVQYKIGISFEEIAPINNIGKVKAQLLLIHGEKDDVVLIKDAISMEKAANKETVELCIISDKGHSDCHEGAEFWNRIKAFLKK
jgi:dipeptidyl aminopeptidase/acylaminoacyl peptidase